MSPDRVAARPIVVQKYGGSSVATTERLRRVAELVVARRRAGADLVVVVSAQGDTTDELLARAKQLSPEPDRRELDMLLTAGERISMALLALAIRQLGHEAVSLTGSQSGILTTASHTHARIIEVRPFRIQDELEQGRIVIVAGYQGVSYRRDVTTLGRGGSDTTAVALAAALDAESCEIYSDVDGVFTADPRVVTDARQLEALGYEEMQALALGGARVLNAAAVEFARQRGIALYARKTGAPGPGTVIRRDVPRPSTGVRGIAHDLDVVFVEGRASDLTRARALLETLGGLGAPAQSLTLDAEGRVSATLDLQDLHALESARRAVEGTLGAGSFRAGLGAVTLVGDGLSEAAGPLLLALAALADAGIAPVRTTTSALTISFLVRTSDVREAAATLHTAFALGRADTAETELLG